jgi:glutaredoxin
VTEVTLLTQTDCALCEHAKQVLSRVAGDVELEIRTVDLSSEEGHRLATSAGVLFAPGVLLDGEPFSFGRLSERKLRRALRGRPAPTATDVTPAET